MHDIVLNKKVLAKNDAIAGENRQRLKEQGIFTINMISAPGAGKTSIVEKTVELIKGRRKPAVIVGDIQTDLDTQRLLVYGIPVRQINTGRSCHLDAHMIYHTLLWLFEQEGIDFLLIENVGNMVCPAEYDLGEDLKVAVMSATEGDDRPLVMVGTRAPCPYISKPLVRISPLCIFSSYGSITIYVPDNPCKSNLHSRIPARLPDKDRHG